MLCALMCGVMAAATALGPSALRSVTSGQTRAGEDSPVYNETTQTGYETLEEAWDNANTGDVLILNNPATITSRRNSNGRAITVKSKEGTVQTITRNSGFTGILFLPNKDSNNVYGEITLENVIIDGAGITGQVIEASSNGTVNLNNVEIRNSITNNTQGLLCVKGGGKLNANDLSFSECSVDDEVGVIFAGTSSITLSGNCQIPSIYIQTDNRINIGDTDLTNTNPIKLYVDNNRTKDLIVNGYTHHKDKTDGDTNYSDPTKFILIKEDASLAEDTDKDYEIHVALIDDIKKMRVNLYTTVDGVEYVYGFPKFHAAHSSTVNDDVIVLNDDIEINHRVSPAGKGVTIKSADPSDPKKITCQADKIFFLSNGNTGFINFEDVILDGGGGEFKTTVMEASGPMSFKNVTIQNYNGTNDQGLICIKGSGKVIAENLVVDQATCSVKENTGQIFVGEGKHLEMSGNCNFSVLLQTTGQIDVVGDLTNTEAIPVIVGDDRKNTIIVNGCGDESKFSVDCIADFALKATADGQNLELVTTKVVDPEESPVVNRTAKRGYDDLTAAFSAASAGDLIVVKEDQTTTDRLAGKSVTIKGENSADATKPVTIKCTKDNFFFIANSKEGPLTLENLVIDGGGDVAWTKAMLEANGGELALKNVTIRNYNTENDCVISYKDNGGSIVTAENLVIEDCSVKDGGAQVSVGNGKDFEINGNCKFSVHLNGSTSQIIVKEALTNTTPIPVIVADDREGTVIVKGCDDVAKFSISNENLKLEAADGDIKLVSAIVVDPKTKPVYNETTGEGYASLKLAIDEAAGEDVLIVNEDQTVSERISIGEKTLTIKGNSNVAISRAEGLNEIMFLANANGGVLNLENLTLKAPQAREKVLIEASNHGAVSLKNVNLADCEIAKGNLVSIKSGGRMAVENVKTVGCTVPEGEGEIFVGTNSGLDMTGNNSFSVKLEGNAHITAGEITHTVPVKIYLSETPAENRVVVSGCDKPELFSLENQAEGYKLVANNGNIEVEVPAAVEDPEDPGKEDPENPGDDEPGDDDPGKVDPENPGDDEPGDDEPGDDDPGKVDADKAVYNETTGKGYSSLTEAFKAAETDAVLVLKENQTVAERLSADGRVITIKSDDNVTISRDKAYNGMLFLVNSEGGVLNMDNVTIDGCNVESDKVVIEASGHGEVNLIDVTLINCMTTADQGIISIKSGGRVVADCLEILSSSVATGKGEVFVGNSSKLAIVGDCLFTIMHQASGNIDASEATHTSPLSLLLDGEHADGTVVASGNSDLSKFTLLTTGYSLAAEGGNLIVKKDANTGIGMIDFDADEEGVEYYDLQGRRIANPSNGIFIRRKGGETLKVYVK